MTEPVSYRVAHLPTSVGGNAPSLSRRLNEIGLRSACYIYDVNAFGYKGTVPIWKPEDGSLTRELKRWKAIVRTALFSDVVHFNFGGGWATPVPLARAADRGLARKAKSVLGGIYLQMLSVVELNLYRLFRRPMFVHYQGDDARQGDACLALFTDSIAHHVEPGYYTTETDALKRLMIKRMERYCSVVYSVNPDLMHVLGEGARFIPYCHISLEDWRPVGVTLEQRPLRIGHAPSHRRAKGTDIILAALQALATEGFEFELVLVEGLSNEAARQKYEQVDIMIDQIHAGWYGGLAVELMAMAKPVMVYIREDDLGFIPPEMREDLPFVRTSSASIKEDLRRLLAMPRETLAEIGRKSRGYVETWHDPRRIALEIKADYDNALRRLGLGPKVGGE
ncbi:hypothetical protein BSY240_4582 (plasmid) [Agrobacterium sp. RAC06]|nr:hypothetical protein BSY240_4582 [Agrobacterium sp. RAC06]